MESILKKLLETSHINYSDYALISDRTIELINSYYISDQDKEDMLTILTISNILYETKLEKLPLEHEVYDILRDKALDLRLVVPVGGVNLNVVVDGMPNNMSLENNAIKDYDTPIRFLSDVIDENTLYADMITKMAPLDIKDSYVNPIKFDTSNVTKRQRNIGHEFDLVGTLNKCKIVMNYQAQEKGVLNDSNMKILERDFFGNHLKSCIIDNDTVFSVLVMLKFDGVSVELTYPDMTYVSRGDAIGDVAVDLTPVLKNYTFPHLVDISNRFGVQFEAIMTYANLQRFNQDKGYSYKNCRTAISGLFNGGDAWKYTDYITMVPLASSLGLRKDIELEFLNKYFSRGVYNNYKIFTGNVGQVLYQIKKFVEEAEMLRDFVPFMYDGVVIQYLDKEMIDRLGRSNAINNFAMAIKFNPLKKSTVFKGYTFTIGQDGYVTPMIHYEPVSFLGTVHPKSSGHSFDRFMELGLRVGDIIDVEYVNDVMPYVTKPENSFNDSNTNPVVEFPHTCPECGTEIIISKSGKSAYCPNIDCVGRKIARVNNMISKLGINGFAEESVKKLSVYSFKELMDVQFEVVSQALNSDILAGKFMDQIKLFKTQPKFDYEVLGALGFDCIAVETWKKILRVINVKDLLTTDTVSLFNILIGIKGIGTVTANTVLDRLHYFIEDIRYVLDMPNVIESKGSTQGNQLKVRITGFRDSQLIKDLTMRGIDIADSSVTKDTNILVVPNMSAMEPDTISGKGKAAIKYGIQVMTLPEFKVFIEDYLKNKENE